jgi:hypothetical protein
VYLLSSFDEGWIVFIRSHRKQAWPDAAQFTRMKSFHASQGKKALTGTLPEDSGLHNYRQTLSFNDSILPENPNGRSLSGGLRSAPYETLGRGV